MAQAASFDKASAQLYRDYLELLKAFGDFGKLVQEAAGDVTLRQRLVQAPQQVLLEGIPLPIDTEIQFLANTSYRLHLLLPALADKAPAVATPNPVKRAMARACGDPSYRALLVNEPRRAFAEENCKLPEGVVVSVREMSNNKLLVVLPEHPDTIFGERTVRRPHVPTHLSRGRDGIQDQLRIPLRRPSLFDGTWARLLKRVFDIDIEHCPNCGGALKIIAAIEDPPVIIKLLKHLGLPARAPARRVDLSR